MASDRKRGLRRIWARIRDTERPAQAKLPERAPLVPQDVMAHAWILQEGLIDGEGSFTTKGLRAVLDALEKQQDGAYKTLIARLVLTAKRAFREAHALQARLAGLETEMDDREKSLRSAEKKARALSEAAKSGAAGEIKRIRTELETKLEEARTKACRYVEELGVQTEKNEEADAALANVTITLEKARQTVSAAYSGLVTARHKMGTKPEEEKAEAEADREG